MMDSLLRLSLTLSRSPLAGAFGEFQYPTPPLWFYPHEAIEAHRAFVARRRFLRPEEEYRAATAEEWDQFLAHFEKRKASVGTCARAFGSPCIHDACLRRMLAPPTRPHRTGTACRDPRQPHRPDRQSREGGLARRGRISPAAQPSSTIEKRFKVACIKRFSEHDQVPPGLPVSSAVSRREGPGLRSAQ